jgi:hypothetical protein
MCKGRADDMLLSSVTNKQLGSWERQPYHVPTWERVPSVLHFLRKAYCRTPQGLTIFVDELSRC